MTGFYSVPGDKSDDAIAAVVKAAPDAILGGPETYARRLRAATQTIPLDCMSEDLVGEGFAASLAKPGGNITGVSLLTPELDGKRQEILIEAVPGVKKIAALAYSAITTKEHLDQLRQSARARGVEMSVFFFAKADEIGPALDAAKAAGCEAINFLANPLQVVSRGVILDAMARIKLPAIYQWPETAELGGLIGYGPIFDQVYRQRARQIVKIFRGATRRRSAGRAARQFFARHQPEDREGDRPHHPGRAVAARRQGDRVAPMPSVPAPARRRSPPSASSRRNRRRSAESARRDVWRGTPRRPR